MHGNHEVAGTVILKRGVQRNGAPSLRKSVASCVNDVGRSHSLVVGIGRERGPVHQLHIDRNVIGLARAAIVNSGTATLETALLGCPQVAVYHLAWSRIIGILRPLMQNWIFAIPYFTLVNILAEKEVIKELVANDFITNKITAELQKLLNDEMYQKNMLADYEHIHSILSTSPASVTAARIIMQMI